LSAVTVVIMLSAATPRHVSAQSGGDNVQGFSFLANTDNIPNPERGFYRKLWPNPLWLGTERNPIRLRDLIDAREQGLTLVHAYWVIDEFRDSPLSKDMLEGLNTDLALVRQAGLKMIPRFSYNFPCAGTTEPCGEGARHEQDASVDRVISHLDQLAPILRANGDVIAFMEIGFVGAWGEWHSSSNGLVNADTTANDQSFAIINRVLWALPESRMALLRYPYVKQQMFGRTPLTAEEAFSGTVRSRIGFHNDCFLASPTSGNTYADPAKGGLTSPAYVAEQKALINQENRFVPQGGETCSVGPSAQPYIQCSNALADLAMERWTTLDADYQREVLDLWRRQGCFPEIERRLGYRFRLVTAEIPKTASVGRPVTATFTIANDGWAAPYNPRAVVLAFRHSQSHRQFAVDVAEDPRRWGAGDTHTFTVKGTVPSDAEPGEYRVLLNFPDPEPTLYARPEYAIRLANDGLWEASTGANVLPGSVTTAK